MRKFKNIYTYILPCLQLPRKQLSAQIMMAQKISNSLIRADTVINVIDPC